MPKSYIEEREAENYVAPDWERFMGNNHEHIKAPNSTWGGGFKVGRHLGKPLTQELWDDLVYRLGIREMRIYRPNAAQWTIGIMGTGVFLYLDDNDLLCDIHLNP